MLIPAGSQKERELLHPGKKHCSEIKHGQTQNRIGMLMYYAEPGILSAGALRSERGMDK